MTIKFWSHKKGFRSPTEQQLVCWEFDGGNQKECEDAILFDGRMYDCPAALLKARVENGIKKAALFFQQHLESRATPPQPGVQLSV